jgi:hypothetical protein
VTVVVADAKKDYTKEEAVKAMGDQAERFVVQDWKKAGDS